MAWNDLKAAVAAVIKANGVQSITGEVLKDSLTNIIDNLGENATYKGVATPSTSPGVPDGGIVYIAGTNGVYANFGGIVLEDEIAMLRFSGGSWNKDLLFDLKRTRTDALYSLTRAKVSVSGDTITVGNGRIYTLYNDGSLRNFNHSSNSYTLTSGQSLVHNKTTNTVHVRSSGGVLVGDAILLQYDGVKGINTGLWYADYVLGPKLELALYSVSRASVSASGDTVTVGTGDIFTLFAGGVLKSLSHTSNSYTLVSGGRLVHNKYTNLLHTRSASELEPGDAVLLQYDGVRGMNSGLWYAYHILSFQNQETSDKINEIESALYSVSRASVTVSGNSVTVGNGNIFTLFADGTLKSRNHSSETYTLVSGGRLVHNKYTNLLHTRSDSELEPGDAVLLQYDGVRGVNSGLWYTFYVLKPTTDTALYSLTRASVTVLGDTITVGGGRVFTLFNDGTLKNLNHSEASYTLVSGGRLVHNKYTNLLHTRSGSELESGDAVLLQYDGAQGINSGLWYAFHVLEPTVVKDVPGYVTDEIIKIIGETNRYKEGKDAFTFGALFDPHSGLNSNRLKYVKWFSEAGKFRACDFMLVGGDVFWVNGTGLTAESIDKAIYAVPKLLYPNNDKVLWMVGNHDDNGQSGLPEEAYISKDIWYNAYLKSSNIELVKPSPKSTYFYKDLVDHKIRIVVLDTHDLSSFNNQSPIGVGGEQLNWLASTALDFSEKQTPGDWGVILFSHACPRLDIGGWNSFPSSHNYLVVVDIIKAWMNASNLNISGGSGIWSYSVSKDFSSQGYNGDMLFSLHGHAHFDNNYHPSGEWMYIISNGSSSNAPQEEMVGILGNPTTAPIVPGTPEETAFDITTVDRTNRKVYIKRFGRGVDREISY